MNTYIAVVSLNIPIEGVTLAQLAKASVGQTNVQRFEPHLGHNWLSCGVFRYTNVDYSQSLPEETRTITVQSLNGLT